jgi:FkbM family methyltransferase
MAFGIFFRRFRHNLLKYPGLTTAAFLFISLNFLLERLHLKTRSNFLKRIRIRVRLPDGSMVRCRLPDLVTISEIYLAGVYDPLQCTDGSVIVDAGANIGIPALKMSKECRNSKIIAVEPSAETFRSLKENLELNGAKNVIPVNAALGDRNGYTDFFVNKADTTTASFFNQPNTISEKVRVVKLDDLLKELGISVDGKKVFVKMDVEGAEMKVLAGAEKLLKRRDISIMLETHPSVVSIETVSDFLKSYGFDVSVLDLNLPYILAKKRR